MARVIATTHGNLAYSPDGTKVVAAYTNPVARVVDAQSGEVILELAHDKSIHSVAFSPDGKRILTVDPDAAAPVLWDAETGDKLADDAPSRVRSRRRPSAPMAA